MKRGEEILKEACAQIAMEEVEALEKSISPKMNQASEALYMRHRRKIFALIARESKKQKNRFAPYYRAAVCLALVVGAAWMLLHPKPQDFTPATQLPTATVMPYYTAEPSPSPSAVPMEMHELSTEVQKEMENEERFATLRPELTEKQTISPTETPKATEKLIVTPTPAPTLPPETLQQFWPDGWTGIYFPGEIPDGYVLLESTDENGKRIAVYADKRGGNISFTEYDGTEMIPIPPNVQTDYVMLHGGIALQLTENDIVTLVWQMEERTLVLTAKNEQIAEIANSVKKISEE